MAVIARAPRLLPPRDLPVVDQSGRFTEVWYEYFQAGISADRVFGTAGDTALTGTIGEFLGEGPTSVALTTATPVDVETITLPAGDYDISAPTQFAGVAATTTTELQCSISTASGSMDNTVGYHEHWRGSVLDLNFTMRPGPVRVLITAPTTYYLVAQANFSGGTYAANGRFVVRRHR
jgi:hypothetical protein